MIRFHSGLEDLMVPASSIRPHPENPNDGDVDEVAASILRVGCYRPIFANRNTTYISGGHTLYAALLSLGAIMVPVVWNDADSLDEVSILVGDNAIARRGQIDKAQELDLLRRLEKSEKGLQGTGHDERSMERLAAAVAKDLEGPLKINLTGGAERLIHEIECPACGYMWVRGQGQED